VSHPCIALECQAHCAPSSCCAPPAGLPGRGGEAGDRAGLPHFVERESGSLCGLFEGGVARRRAGAASSLRVRLRGADRERGFEIYTRCTY
jgi:hypothetical protein